MNEVLNRAVATFIVKTLASHHMLGLNMEGTIVLPDEQTVDMTTIAMLICTGLPVSLTDTGNVTEYILASDVEYRIPTEVLDEVCKDLGLSLNNTCYGRVLATTFVDNKNKDCVFVTGMSDVTDALAIGEIDRDTRIVVIAPYDDRDELVRQINSINMGVSVSFYRREARRWEHFEK